MTLFRKHRDDLLASMEREREAWRMVVTVLADQVEYLRYMVTKTPHLSPALRNLTAGETQPVGDAGTRPYLTEDEEELLALRINEHIDDARLRELAKELNIPVPSLEPDATTPNG